MWMIDILFLKVSVIVGKRTLFLFNLQDPENPIGLAFQNRYGNIVSYQWYVDIGEKI